MAKCNSPTSTSSTSSLPSSDGSPQSKQMDEMLGLLKDISTDLKTKKSRGVESMDSSSTQQSETTTAHSYPILSSWSLPVACHPIRKRLCSSSRMMMATLCIVLFSLIVGISIISNNHSSSIASSAENQYNTNKASANVHAMNQVLPSFSKTSAVTDKTLYYNAGVQGKEDQLLPLSPDLYLPGGPVIVCLVANNDKDTEDLSLALRSLAFLSADKERPNPVLVFNEGDLTPSSMEIFRKSTNRPIAFPIVDFTKFPSGFDPEAPENNVHHFEVSGRKSWGYYQMIRFFVTLVWDHPSIERYEYIMRLDSDGCFKSPNTYLPYMKYDHAVYHSQYVGVVGNFGKKYLEGLFDFADNYDKQPSNPVLWHFIETTWKEKGTLPLFMTNFEISKKSWMNSPQMKKWHETLTEKPPYGIMRYRWGDAITRFLEAAMFGTDETIITTWPEGYHHKKACPREEVEEAMRQHGLL